MTPARALAALQMSAGALQLRRPEAALSLFGYPSRGLRPRLVVQVLGLRHLLQGAAELTGNRTLLRTGAAVDSVHAATALLYARRSTVGRHAGQRNAALAVGFATAQLYAAARAKERRTPARPASRHAPDSGAATTSASEPTPGVARVNGPSSQAWPEPTDPGQHVLVEYPTDGAPLVRLEGGTMDGATVSLSPGAHSYRILDTEKGPLVYEPVKETTDPDGLPVLRLQTAADESPHDAGDSACWSHLLCEQCGAVPDDPAEARCARCSHPR